MVISEFAAIEFCAVVSRGLRARRFDLVEAAEILADMDLLRAECEAHAHGRADFALAEQLVRDYSTKLAAPDALHLASSINAGATLATFDLRLAGAARLRGVKAVVPA